MMDLNAMPEFMFMLMFDILGKGKTSGGKTMRNFLMTFVSEKLTTAQKVKGLAFANLINP